MRMTPVATRSSMGSSAFGADLAWSRMTSSFAWVPSVCWRSCWRSAMSVGKAMSCRELTSAFWAAWRVLLGLETRAINTSTSSFVKLTVDPPMSMVIACTSPFLSTVARVSWSCALSAMSPNCTRPDTPPLTLWVRTVSSPSCTVWSVAVVPMRAVPVTAPTLAVMPAPQATASTPVSTLPVCSAARPASWAPVSALTSSAYCKSKAGCWGSKVTTSDWSEPVEVSANPVAPSPA